MNDIQSEEMDFSLPVERNLKPEHAEAINDIFEQLKKIHTQNEYESFWYWQTTNQQHLTTIEQQQITADPRDVSPYKHIWSI